MPASRFSACSPAKRHNITLQYDIAHSPIAAHKKLKRMPHLFSRVLQLPCNADALVNVEETPESYVFVIQQPGLLADEVRVEVVEIVPGAAVKVVVYGSAAIMAALEELEVDLWRFRLPSCTLPEATSATYVNGVLTVTVPKSLSSLSTELTLDKGIVESENKSFSETEGTYQPEGPASARSGVWHECNAWSQNSKCSFTDGVQNASCNIDFIKNFVETITGFLVAKLFYYRAPFFSSLLKVDLPNGLKESECRWLAAL